MRPEQAEPCAPAATRIDVSVSVTVDEAMRLARPRMHGRAILGVVALYALLLQAFVAAATPSGGAIDLAGFTCRHENSAPSPDQPARHDHQCCTAVHIGNVAPPPCPGVTVVWTAPRPIAVPWRSEAAIPKTRPPTRSHSARGPPSA